MKKYFFAALFAAVSMATFAANDETVTFDDMNTSVECANQGSSYQLPARSSFFNDIQHFDIDELRGFSEAKLIYYAYQLFEAVRNYDNKLDDFLYEIDIEGDEYRCLEDEVTRIHDCNEDNMDDLSSAIDLHDISVLAVVLNHYYEYYFQ